MEKETLLSLIETDFTKAYDRIRSFQKVTDYEDLKKQYECSEHAINRRENKWITIPDPHASEDSDKTIDQEVITTKLPLSDQEIIVSRAASFLCGNPIEIDANAQTDQEKYLVEVIKKSLADNKMNYEDVHLCELLFSEKEVAELWYPEITTPDYWKGTPNEGKTFEDPISKQRSALRLRLRILSNSMGDSLYPIYNKVGDMVGFGRGYAIKNNDGEDEPHFDLYTDEKFYYWTQIKEQGWGNPEMEANVIGKIPVIYHYKPKTEYQNVQKAIERREFSISLHGDINDYNAGPTRFVTGKILGWSKKAEAGSVLEGAPGSDVKILEWNHAPESIKLEQDNLRSLIYDNTDTPDISFSQMKALFGTTPAAAAIRLLFTAAHMKASRNEGIYGKGVQRRFNLLKAFSAKINISLEPALTLNIKPKFEYYLPKNDEEKVNTLVTAVTGGIMSKETAVRQNPLVEDGDSEFKIVKAEDEAKQGAQGLDSLMNGNAA